MRIKHFLSLIFLFTLPLLHANPSLATLKYSNAGNERVQVFPAPTNFQATVVTPTSITFVWDNPPTPRAHRIRVYRTIDGVLLNTTDVPAGTNTALIAGLPVGTSMDAENRAVDVNGEEGEPAFIKSIDGIILDLVVKGYTNMTGPLGCSLSQMNRFCEFNPTLTGFQIMPSEGNGTAPTRKFNVSRYLPYTPDHFWVTPDETINPQIQILCTNSTTACFSTPNIIIKGPVPNQVGITTIANIDVIKSGNTYYLYWNSLNSNYVIRNIGAGRPEGDINDQATQREDTWFKDASLASAQPNPFSETLDVFVPVQAENVHIQLFNLSGQKVLDQQFTGGQEQYTLSTSDLANGFYLLRVEVDGQVQTLKMIKS